MDLNDALEIVHAMANQYWNDRGRPMHLGRCKEALDVIQALVDKHFEEKEVANG